MGTLRLRDDEKGTKTTEEIHQKLKEKGETKLRLLEKAKKVRETTDDTKWE